MSASGRVLAKQVLRRALERTQFQLAASAVPARAEGDRAALLALNRVLLVVRMAPGDYGECERCGELISDRRMDAAPWSTRCDRHSNDPIQ